MDARMSAVSGRTYGGNRWRARRRWPTIETIELDGLLDRAKAHRES